MSNSTPITHIVLFRYRSGLTWSQLESHFDQLKALKRRCVHPSTGEPYMIGMRMGRNLSWEPFNKGLTHAFVLEFASQADLDYYLLKDPVHAAFSKSALPLIEDSTVMDIRDGILFGDAFVKPGTPAHGVYKGHCHCGGGPYSCNYIVPEETLAITRGKPGHYQYKGASGKFVHCYFCPTCTSHIYHHQDAMPEKVIVRTLLLDGGNQLKKGAEIFEEGQLGWVRDLDEALSAPSKKLTNGPNHGGQYSPDDDDPYAAQPQNPFTDHMNTYQPHGRTPSPGHPLGNMNNASYHHEPLEMPMGPGPGNGLLTPSDRLEAQPTYSVENIPNTYGHNEGYDSAHPYNPTQAGDGYAIDPQQHHDAYYNQPYEPTTPYDEHDVGQNGTHNWQDEVDDKPMIPQGGAYGPDPHQIDAEAGFDQPPPQPAAPIRRWKTVKEVQLFNGNLVLDCPVPPRLLNQVQHAQPPERDEFTHMRYSAATCDPAHFYDERFTLRQRLFAKPRHTELFIVITMYNEEDELFARTMMGVIKNIEYMNSRTSSKTWGKEAWKKIVVCVVSDGRAKINPRTRAVLAAMGVYQDGIAKQQVNGRDVTAHIYEYTTQMNLEIKNHVVQVKKGNTPVQMLFCLKEKNQKKINSHRWFFQAFGQVLDPNICVLIDAGTKPGRDSIYKLWKVFDVEPMCAGACGEIKAMLSHGKNLLNPLVAAQNFEYKMSNILDKPLESAFGFISVLPGAFSAYRYVALQNDKTGQGPLEKYFKGETMHGANAGIFTANMYLAEDRILCFELVSKRNCSWILQYVKSASGETDVPTEMADFILQRRRWLNGSFFAAVYALTHFYQIFRSKHSCLRTIGFLFEFFYQFISMLFAWFAIGNFFLVFRILTTSLGEPSLNFAPGNVLAVVFEFLYLGILITCFVLALGNRPQGSNKFYMSQVYFWAVLMMYLMFATVFITVKSVQAQVATGGFTFSDLFTNALFRTLILSMLATYVLYFVASILFLDPWHMLTCFVQYLLLTPTYINILNVYAFCNTHDITWGTKGDDKPEKLGSATTKPGGKVDVAIPTDDHDLNSQYENELRVFATKWAPPKKIPSAEEKHEDYYKGFRSAVVICWMFCNLILAAVVLNAGGLERINVDNNEETQRSTIYMSVVLYSVVFLSAIRWVGCVWFLVVRVFRGV
ncbi:Chitin synthase 4 [Elsinoe australis]|uniref:chitin synthase n=1 Tax=Elsinoe australis TaxID=40998 RepID=A0A2P8ADQ8_9PEZI|nr:Chitin synthase 4 [Elsinoe australis]